VSGGAAAVSGPEPPVNCVPGCHPSLPSDTARRIWTVPLVAELVPVTRQSPVFHRAEAVISSSVVSVI
jgi:hypothetical protein